MKYLLSIVILVLVVVGVIFLTRNRAEAPEQTTEVSDQAESMPATEAVPDQEANSPQPPPAANEEQPAPAEEESPAPTKIEIQMTDQGFQPSQVTVKQGTTVRFVSTGNQSHWPASAVHPTHLVYPEFDPKQAIAPGASWEFIFDQVGSWRFHDHLNPSLTGTVNVTE